MLRFLKLIAIRAGIGLALIVVAAAQSLASPYYSVRDLGTVPAGDSTGGGELLAVDQSGNVRFFPQGGFYFGNQVSGPQPAGDQSYNEVVKASDNGLYSIGKAWNPIGQHFDTYIVSGGKATVIATDSLSASYSANAVNNSGQVAGSEVTVTPGSQFGPNGPAIDTPGKGWQFIGMSGGYAAGINNLGQVVGGMPFQSSNAALHAFVWTNDGQPPSDLNTLIDSTKWNLTIATGINDKGQIVAYGTDPSGQDHALLLTPINSNASLLPTQNLPAPPPIPEPSTLFFLGLILSAAGLKKLIRRGVSRRAGR